jgi:hypothetical protein
MIYVWRLTKNKMADTHKFEDCLHYSKLLLLSLKISLTTSQHFFTHTTQRTWIELTIFRNALQTKCIINEQIINRNEY